MENEKQKKKVLETAEFQIDDLSALKACIVYFTAIILGFFFGFAKRDRNNQYVRFNAFQALLLWAVFAVVAIFFFIFILIFVSSGVFALVIIFQVLMGLCYLFLFAVMVFTSFMAYNGKQFTIPLIGGWARNIVYGKQPAPDAGQPAAPSADQDSGDAEKPAARRKNNSASQETAAANAPAPAAKKSTRPKKPGDGK